MLYYTLHQSIFQVEFSVVAPQTTNYKCALSLRKGISLSQKCNNFSRTGLHRYTLALSNTGNYEMGCLLLFHQCWWYGARRICIPLVLASIVSWGQMDLCGSVRMLNR